MSEPDPIRQWSRASLRSLLPDSTEAYRRARIIDLVAAGALVRRGRYWLGRRSDVERALLAPTAEAAR